MVLERTVTASNSAGVQISFTARSRDDLECAVKSQIIFFSKVKYYLSRNTHTVSGTVTQEQAATRLEK